MTHRLPDERPGRRGRPGGEWTGWWPGESRTAEHPTVDELREIDPGGDSRAAGGEPWQTPVPRSGADPWDTPDSRTGARFGSGEPPAGIEPGEFDDVDEPGGGAHLLLVPFLLGCLVAVSLGVYGSIHEPTGIAVSLAGFSGPLEAKVWLGTGALVFALVQLGSALVMYGKVPGLEPPEWIGVLHRWSGRVAFLLAVPVAVHCLYAAGFATFNSRVLIHSLLGCVFFGAFVVKMLGLRRDGLPGWALPTIGGVLFAVLVGLWWTSSWWYFTTFGVQV